MRSALFAAAVALLYIAGVHAGIDISNALFRPNHRADEELIHHAQRAPPQLITQDTGQFLVYFVNLIFSRDAYHACICSHVFLQAGLRKWKSICAILKISRSYLESSLIHQIDTQDIKGLIILHYLRQA
jgi:hypothetical protein